MARESALPADLEERLAAGAVALGVALDAGQRRALVDYVALLAKWNRVYNLTAVRDPADMLTQHLLDSLAIVGPLSRHLAGRPARLLDVGSGAGLPGVVIALLRRDIDVTCVDAVSKKAAFVREAAGALGAANLHALHARVEALELPRFDVITARAFATLVELVNVTRHLLASDGAWMAMKARDASNEIAALPADIQVFHVEQLRVPGLDAERRLVWMRPR